MADIKIACPFCNWEPDGQPYWSCSQCGYVWDTFQTAACCPACQFQHEHTQCIAFAGGCNEVSPHEDWYRNLEEVLGEELKDISIRFPSREKTKAHGQ